MTTMHRTRAGRLVSPSRWGFTLVELLLVMFILSVLVALTVGVSWYVIEEGRKKETVNTQKRLIAAIDAYSKVSGKVPDVVYEPDSSVSYKWSPSEHMARLTNQLTTGSQTNNNPDVTAPLYKATRPFLDGVSTTDAYGNSMLYLKEGGLGGRPVIVSAGPDGKFGYEVAYKLKPEDQKKYQKDNIRSDMN